MNIQKIKKDNTIMFAKNRTIFLTGKIEQLNPNEFLDPFFEMVISKMGDSVINEGLILDVRQLNFMNSSGLRAILSFIMKRKGNIKLSIKIDNSKTWQRTSLKIAAKLDPAVVIIENEPL